MDAPFVRTRVDVPGEITLSLPTGGLVVLEPLGIDDSSLPLSVDLTDSTGQRYPAQQFFGALASGLYNTVPLYPAQWRLAVTLSSGRRMASEFDAIEGQITRVGLDRERRSPQTEPR